MGINLIPVNTVASAIVGLASMQANSDAQTCVICMDGPTARVPACNLQPMFAALARHKGGIWHENVPYAEWRELVRNHGNTNDQAALVVLPSAAPTLNIGS